MKIEQINNKMQKYCPDHVRFSSEFFRIFLIFFSFFSVFSAVKIQEKWTKLIIKKLEKIPWLTRNILWINSHFFRILLNFKKIIWRSQNFLKTRKH